MHNNSGGFIIGGLVFGRDLKTCVNDTATDAVRLTPPTAESSQSGEVPHVSASVKYMFIHNVVQSPLSFMNGGCLRLWFVAWSTS